MKKIKIFLASSLTDLELDRIRIGDFIRQLNDLYVDRGYYFSLIRCDDYDDSMSTEGKQEELNREIRDSELCFFLFFTKVGEYTREEFRVAWENFKDLKKPRIITFFKYEKVDAQGKIETQEEVKEFMKTLDGEYKHYYNVYQNIDTLKLKMLLQIRRTMKLDEVPYVEDGKIRFGDTVIGETDRIPFFWGNGAYTALKAEYDAANKEYERLFEQLSNAPSKSLRAEFGKFAAKRERLLEELQKKEEEVLKQTEEMLKRISESELSAENELSFRQKAAYRAMELGEQSLVLEIIDHDEIMAEIARKKDSAQKQIQIRVDELMLRIDVREKGALDEATVQEILKEYEDVRNLLETHPTVKKEPLLRFVGFLIGQTQTAEALSIAQGLKKDYEGGNGNDEERAILYTQLGSLYVMRGEFSTGIEALSSAVEIYQRLSESNPEYVFELTLAYSQLAGAQLVVGEEVDEERLLFLFRNCIGKSVSAFAGYSAMCSLLLTLGFNYIQKSQYEKAKLVCEALEHVATQMADRLATDVGKANLANGYFLWGALDLATEQYEAAKDMFINAENKFRALYNKNPKPFAVPLSYDLFMLSTVYCILDCKEEAERTFKEAQEILNFFETNPETELPFVTNIMEMKFDKLKDALDGRDYNGLGATRLYLLLKLGGASESSITESLKERRMLMEKFREAQNSPTQPESEEKSINKEEMLLSALQTCLDGSHSDADVAERYLELAKLYLDNFEDEKAKIYYMNAVTEYSRLAEENPQSYGSCLCECFKGIGILHYRSEQYEEAANYFMDYANLASKLELSSDAQNGYWRAKVAYENLSQKEPKKFEPLLADLYFRWYETEKAEEGNHWHLDDAYHLALKYPENERCMEIIEKYERRMGK